MKLVAMAAAIAASLALGPFAWAGSNDQQQAVDDAVNVVQHIHNGTDDTSAKARDLIRKARAVLIVPDLVKGGFIFGAEGGAGVLLARDSKGDWTAPAFYKMGAASFGFQIGVEVSKLVLIIMDQKALDAVMRNELKLGAEAGLAIATLGASGEASTTTNAGADIYAIAESKGLFGGIAVQGGILNPRDSWDADYYGHKVTVGDILVRRVVSNPGASALRQALGHL